MRILQIDDDTRGQINKAIEYAKKHVMTAEIAQRIQAGEEHLIPGMTPEHVTYIHDGYRVVYSQEQHKVLCHHISVSVEDKTMCPNIPAVQLILQEFGMSPDIKASMATFIDKENAVNIIQKVGSKR